MRLRCQVSGMKCPRYDQDGFFYPDDETVERLLPDVNRCADCMAYAPPRCPDFRDDLRQTALIVLIEKGPKFDPTHQSGASFGTFIRPQICGTLLNTKRKELEHCHHEFPLIDEAVDFYGEQAAETDREVGCLHAFADENAAFEDELVRDISLEAVLPELLQALTEREREVFVYLREDQQNYEIAETLNLSTARVSQLVRQVLGKLAYTGQRLGLAE